MMACVKLFIKPYSVRLGLALLAIFLIAACASSTLPKQQNAAVNAAQAMERRAAQAYLQGDLQAAAATYASAALVYESLALAEPLARARLSEARVLGEAGQTERALQLVDAVLTPPATANAGLGADTLVLAHGRAAALHLALHEASSSATTTTVAATTNSSSLLKAQTHWQSAQTACASTCGSQAALQVLRSRIDLAQGNPIAAVQSASAALAASTPVNTAEQANALRARAQAQAALRKHSGTVADANAALELDQQAGSVSKVGIDLDLLSAAHQALGDSAQAQRYAQLAQRARAAAIALQRGAP